jgi:BirA family biotin operon repressor/biotin-[acetyl-CoA-carboxylase] ligase
MMQTDEIQAVLKSRLFGRELVVFKAIDSTNRYAKMLAVQGSPEGTVVYAEAQTKGRGRWGKTWDSACRKGLWFSIILRPTLKLDKITQLTLLGTTSVAASIKKDLGLECSVKWPNDLLIQDKKVGGILLETSQRQSQPSYVVMGVGLNVCHTIRDFSEKIRKSAVSLEMVSNQPIDRLSLFAGILFQLERDYLRSQKEGFDFVLSRWIAINYILEKVISFKFNHRFVQGRVKGFHVNGDLVLIKPNGEEERYRSSDVREVRYVDGY